MRTASRALHRAIRGVIQGARRAQFIAARVHTPVREVWEAAVHGLIAHRLLDVLVEEFRQRLEHTRVGPRAHDALGLQRGVDRQGGRDVVGVRRRRRDVPGVRVPGRRQGRLFRGGLGEGPGDGVQDGLAVLAGEERLRQGRGQVVAFYEVVPELLGAFRVDQRLGVGRLGRGLRLRFGR